jgi:uncharacterized caspase-like protein
LTGQNLKEMFGNIPTTKKMFIFDTCNAGGLGGTLRSTVKTRGFSEKAAITTLNRAVGSISIFSSDKMQEAIDEYKNHGLFTYVLVDGLSGNADENKDSLIDATELFGYTSKHVPEIAEKEFGRAQYPTVDIKGQIFPVGKRF